MTECRIVDLRDLKLSRHNSDDGLYISRIHCPKRNWKLIHNDSIWNRLFNKWLAKVLNEDKGTNVLLNYQSVELSEAYVAGKTGSVRIHLTRDPTCTIPYPWFCLSDVRRYSSYIFKDYLFVEVPKDCSIENIWIGTSLGWVDTRKPNTYPPYILKAASNRVLDLQHAIVLQTTGKSTLLAIPWYSEFVSDRKQVERYCKNIFKWFKRRYKDPYFTEPCPASIAIRTDKEDLRMHAEYSYYGLHGVEPTWEANIFSLTNWFDLDGTGSPDYWRKFFNLE